MARKRCYLISAAILAACACIALGVLALMPPKPGVTKANFDRVEDDMTMEEAEAVLGTSYYDIWEGRIWFHEADGTQILITLDERARVNGKRYTPSTEPFTDKFRRWLGFEMPPRFIRPQREAAA